MRIALQEHLKCTWKNNLRLKNERRVTGWRASKRVVLVFASSWFEMIAWQWLMRACMCVRANQCAPYRSRPLRHVEYSVCVGAGLLNGSGVVAQVPAGQIGNAKNAGVRNLLNAKAFNHFARWARVWKTSPLADLHAFLMTVLFCSHAHSLKVRSYIVSQSALKAKLFLLFSEMSLVYIGKQRRLSKYVFLLNSSAVL